MLFPSLVKGLTALSYNKSTGVTLASRGSTASEKFQGLNVLSLQDSLCCSTLRALVDIIIKILLYAQLPRNAPTWTKFQWFMSDPQLSSFEKLIVSTPRLLRGIHTMSLAKAALDGLKDRKCKRITLSKHPWIPYVPKKDSVQETVSAFKAESLKTQIGEGMKHQVPIWRSGMHKAFLIHLGSALDAIKKEDTSRPMTKPMKPTWSNTTWWSNLWRTKFWSGKIYCIKY